MVLATPHPYRLSGHATSFARLHSVHALLPGWALALAYLAILGALTAGVWVVTRAAKRMSKPGRIVVGLVAVWTVGSSIAVFLDGYRPTGDWRGGFLQAAFVVLYGLVAAGLVWAIDKTAGRFRAGSPV